VIPQPKTRFLAAALVALLAARPAVAQVNNTWVIPRGVLRLGFSPWYTNYDHRFALDGTLQPLGADLSSDSMPASFFPTMVPAELALQAITANSGLKLNLGKFTNTLDADIRRFPLSAALGLTDRITFSVNVPIVTVRMNDRLIVDSASKQVGWNQTLSAAANGTALAQVQALVSQLDAAAGVIDAGVNQNLYGCPASAQCAQAKALAIRARAVRDNIVLLTGSALTTGAPPFAPLASSAAGTALTAAIQALAAQLATFGATGVTATLPLPTKQTDTSDVQTVLLDPSFGYSADSLVMRRRTTIGDVELGLHVGVAQSAAFRLVLNGIVRLPTGNLASPASFTALSTGDHQTDLEAGFDAAFEPGSTIGLWASAAYTAQLPDHLSLRVGPLHSPIALASYERPVERNLGDILRIAFGPELRLSPEVRVFGSATYWSKAADTYVDGPSRQVFTGPPGPSADVLNQESAMRTWSFGGGISYRSTRAHSGEKLPIEAGIHYSAAYSGSGGFTPQATSMGLYLRLFYRVFGAEPAPAEPPPKPPGN
jgi:hypothetical protein